MGESTTQQARDQKPSDELDYKSTKHFAVDEVEALLKHYGAHTSPQRVAELIVEHGGEAQIEKYIHAHSSSLGAGFWKKVVDAMPRAKKADRVDIGFNGLNKHDKGTGSTGADPNRLAEHKASGLTNAKTIAVTHMYANDGSIMGEPVDKDQTVELNTGAVKSLKIDGKNHDYVFGFHVKEQNGKAVSGWIRVLDLDDTGHHLAKVDKKIAHEVAEKHKGMHFDNKHAHTVVAKDAPASFDNLRLASTSKPTSSNQPHDYYNRGNGAVNFLANVPNTGENDEKKFGIATDIVKNGSTFIPATPRLEKSVQLFKNGEPTLTTHKITFVYGKCEKDGQPASFGWINADCLSEATHEVKA